MCRVSIFRKGLGMVFNIQFLVSCVQFSFGFNKAHSFQPIALQFGMCDWNLMKMCFVFPDDDYRIVTLGIESGNILQTWPTHLHISFFWWPSIKPLCLSSPKVSCWRSSMTISFKGSQKLHGLRNDTLMASYSHLVFGIVKQQDTNALKSSSFDSL